MRLNLLFIFSLLSALLFSLLALNEPSLPSPELRKVASVSLGSVVTNPFVAEVAQADDESGDIDGLLEAPLSTLLISQVKTLLGGDKVELNVKPPAPSSLKSLNSTVSTFLKLEGNTFVLTVVQARAPTAEKHNPHKAKVQRYVRSASHFLSEGEDEQGDDLGKEPPTPSMPGFFVNDMEDWHFLWEEELDGPVEMTAESPSRRTIAVVYRVQSEWSATHRIRVYESQDAELDVDNISEGRGLAQVVPASYDIEVQGSTWVTSLAVCEDYVIYARKWDFRVFRTFLRREVDGKVEWTLGPSGPLADRSKGDGYSETIALHDLQANLAHRHSDDKFLSVLAIEAHGVGDVMIVFKVFGLRVDSDDLRGEASTGSPDTTEWTEVSVLAEYKKYRYYPTDTGSPRLMKSAADSNSLVFCLLQHILTIDLEPVTASYHVRELIFPMEIMQGLSVINTLAGSRPGFRDIWIGNVNVREGSRSDVKKYMGILTRENELLILERYADSGNGDLGLGPGGVFDMDLDDYFDDSARLFGGEDDDDIDELISAVEKVVSNAPAEEEREGDGNVGTPGGENDGNTSSEIVNGDSGVKENPTESGKSGGAPVTVKEGTTKIMSTARSRAEDKFSRSREHHEAEQKKKHDNSHRQAWRQKDAVWGISMELVPPVFLEDKFIMSISFDSERFPDGSLHPIMLVLYEGGIVASYDLAPSTGQNFVFSFLEARWKLFVGCTTVLGYFLWYQLSRRFHHHTAQRPFAQAGAPRL